MKKFATVILGTSLLLGSAFAAQTPAPDAPKTDTKTKKSKKHKKHHKKDSTTATTPAPTK